MKRNADKDFPIMHKYAGKLFKAVEPVFSETIKLKENDHFGFMALCFVHKQIEHARSLGILIDAKQHVDAVTLARVMLEGLIYILWARLDPIERALTWRSFILVCDLETLLEAKKRGDKIDKNLESRLRQRLTEEAKRFLTKNARTNGEDKYENPYQKFWNVDKDGRRIELSRMVSEISDPLLKSLYDDLSQLSHWTPRGIGPLINRTDQGVRINFESSTNATTAYAVCIQALGGTAKAAAEHLDLSILEKIDSIFSSYLAELGVEANHDQ